MKGLHGLVWAFCTTPVHSDDVYWFHINIRKSHVCYVVGEEKMGEHKKEVLGSPSLQQKK
jgi:hypothetical protein